ncbi:hypothetical protein [Leisingera sp. F5]|uniref:hypothetical protein n=1 Tax=Leisingera sp. F5 TaxID=1813816 RepID=UPI000A7A6DA3|nr:hypothetical protein [Leisingera sp. F5]
MAKSEVCKNCCPDGGAIFELDFGCWPHVSTKEWMAEPAWVKVCNNCGHYKPKRKSKPKLTFDEILNLTDETRLKNKRDRAIFHAFAEAGAWKKYKATCEEYAQNCKDNGIEKFPVVAHHWINTYHRDKLAEHQKESAWAVNYHVSRLKADAEKVKAMLAQDFPTREAQ